MADQSNKTEKATPHKLREAKKKGQVSKSNEVTGLLMFCLFAVSLFVFGRQMWDGLTHISRFLIAQAGQVNATQPAFAVLFGNTANAVSSILVPLLLILVAGAIGFNLIQTGFILSSHPIKPDWNRVNPVQGAKKLFAKKALFELFKGLLKVFAITGVWWFFGDTWLAKILAGYKMSPTAFSAHWITLTFHMLVLVFVLLLPMTVLDLAFSHWDFGHKMRMSKQDVKDEYKKREGDPQVKQKQKQIQRELLKKASALKQVKDADVIITNPQHIAVALQYIPKTMLAPKILAMGEDHHATTIRKIARSYNIPIICNVPLARHLYRHSIIDGFIPKDSYSDVATVFRELFARRQRQEPTL